MPGIVDWYRDLMQNKIDKRTEDWFLVTGPGPLLMIFVTYIYFSTSAGPKYMRDKKPYSLKHVLIIYNFIQVVLSCTLVYEGLASGWWNDYSFGCQPVDRSMSPKALRMARAVWLYYIYELWCHKSNFSTSLKQIVVEEIFRLASVFQIKCTKCNKINSVNTSSYQIDTKNHKQFERNSRLAFAFIDPRIGKTQINTIFSALNTPIINSALLKRYEKIVGVAIEKVAKDSCRDFIHLEKELRIDASKKQSSDTTAPPGFLITVPGTGPERRKLNLRVERVEEGAVE
ncbi:very long chain fatty acid elongase 5 isoform X1 [Cotesia typhae]|uniref:very long chain fatty acid elongase 5 isoform X1 n=1 Tax=Cotesia typhae TaxID=2053667 RepID=UPI003D695985